MSTAIPESAIDHRRHTAYSDPGGYAGSLAALPTDPSALSAVARNMIVHYRAAGQELPRSSDDDIDLRWLNRMLEVDHHRHGTPLATHREPATRLQGCCRDHTLVCVGALRTQGVPARSRVGFAGYFVDGWHHDHVVVEAWMGGRWRRFDPEVAAPLPGLETPTDMPVAEPPSAGFVTAAQAWLAHRAGRIDANRYGVDPGLPELSGERFLLGEVIYEIAHRFGDELLLWDCWGRMGEPEEPVTAADAAWADDVAALVLAADHDPGAEARLLQRYRSDDGLHPGSQVLHASPRGTPPTMVDLSGHG